MADKQKQEELIEAGAFTIGGMAGGGILSGIAAGNVSLVVGSTAASLSLMPIVAVGAVTGLALYGSKKAFKSSGLQTKYVDALNTFIPSKLLPSNEGEESEADNK